MLRRKHPHLVRRLFELLKPLPAGSWIYSKFLGFYIPYSGTTGFMVEDLGDGRATVRMAERPSVRNHLDSIHAVALANLGELATGLAVHSALPSQARGILRRLSVEFVKKARGGVVATCSVGLPQESGKHDVEASAVVKDASGDVVATVTALWRVEF